MLFASVFEEFPEERTECLNWGVKKVPGTNFAELDKALSIFVSDYLQIFLSNSATC